MVQVKDKRDVLRKTQEMLAASARGLNDLLGSNPELRPIGIYNLAVFGRSVTLVLQNLRAVDRQGFDNWYAPYRQEMQADHLFVFFTNLRNEILKQGAPSPSMSMHIEYLDGRMIADLQKNPPPGARSFFIGDNLGGSGWEVELPDGSIAKYYVKIPESFRIQISLHLPDPPSEHLGQELTDSSIENLGRLYVDYLTKLVKNAELQFGAN